MTPKTGVSKTGENKKFYRTLGAWFKWLNHHTKAPGAEPAPHMVGVPCVPTCPQPPAPSEEPAQPFGLKKSKVTPEVKSFVISG